MHVDIEQKKWFGRILLAVITSFSIVLVVNVMLDHHVYRFFDPHSFLFNRIYLIAVAFPILILAINQPQPLSSLGFATENWKKSIIEGVLISLLIIPLVILIKILIKGYEGSLLIKPGVYAYSYFTSVILQQSIRSFFQMHLHDILDHGSNIYSCVVSSFLFSMMHIHFGFLAMLLTFLMGLIFSFFYLRHKNIYGLCIMHTSLGITAFSTGLI